ncbi:MAG: Ig-like domain-containing protein, partial [Patescibacteria group bacterium]
MANSARKTTHTKSAKSASAHSQRKSSTRRNTGQRSVTTKVTPATRSATKTDTVSKKSPPKKATKNATKKATKKVAKKAAKKAAKRATQHGAQKTSQSRVTKSPSKSTAKTKLQTRSPSFPTRRTPARTRAKKAVDTTTVITDQTESLSMAASGHADTDTVALPRTWALRVHDKAQAWQALLERDFGPVMHRVIYVSAMCFTLVGLALIVFPHTGMSPFTPQSAQLINATKSPTEESDNTIPFQLTTTIPDQITKSFPVTFQTDARERLTATLHSEAGVRIPLSITAEGDTTYSVTIPADIPVGYYQLYVTRTTRTDNFAPIYRSQEFLIKPTSTPAQSTSTNPDTAPTTTATRIAPTAPEAKATTSETDDSRQTEQSIVTSTAPTTTPTGSNEDTQASASPAGQEPAEPPSGNAGVQPAVSFTATPGVSLSGFATLQMQLTGAMQRMELLARPALSLTAQHVTMARQRPGGWVFAFNTATLPNGEYELIVQATTSDGQMVSDSLRVTIANSPRRLSARPPLDTSRVEMADNSLQTLDTNSTTTPSAATPAPRPRLQIDDDPLRILTPTTSAALKRTSTNTPLLRSSTSRQLIASNRDRLNQLLERYAVVSQTGNDVALETVQQSLVEERQQLLEAALASDTLAERVTEVEADLESFTTEMQRRIDLFEVLRRERSAGDAGVDTDGDGISDYDEQVLYGTDPLSPDTDGDGVGDGIEVIRGFNPRAATAETVMTFESPRDTVGLERPETLQIKRVQPVITPDTPEESGVIAATIAGVALPNSLVRLYIYSSPTIVTVETDADGAFVYTFEKELADGEHEVYVAITDNTGAIIAQSQPFRFVKEAAAFTPAAASRTGLGNTAAIEPPPPAYHTAAGAGM